MKDSTLFKELHSKSNFFVLPNAWDVPSARFYESLGYKAIGTSSWALSYLNGKSDGENISFSTVLSHARQLLSEIKIPLSIDIEKGYASSAKEISVNVIKLAELGCSGVNIEDSLKDGELLPVSDFAKILENIKSELITNGYSGFVLNARTDTYLSGSIREKVKETIKRENIYRSCGADCLFVPGLTSIEEIQDISKSTELPLNVMNMPSIANINTLAENGVNRFSLGNSVFDDVYSYFQSVASSSLKKGDFSVHYNHPALS
ncbi:isocitrate lyase/phosphoenolpyruvate mutase family protein [Xenorhabdus sp. TS4]|uniref:isocitrate lyase/PEP mutase family protein n=1 Tax=Xenorhabdus sp. TS4 TaxID=1873483 RepID=UPI00165728A7|nr:isocitrate lyase/phosphoenolpyruvate mutase family protein [Xenorhabdus sp. TS4]MBC8951088.1 carboxyvinyl-carboxyphosphonate phosphorylmutase [Xenorhabdus sp. TS4]